MTEYTLPIPICGDASTSERLRLLPHPNVRSLRILMRLLLLRWRANQARRAAPVNDTPQSIPSPSVPPPGSNTSTRATNGTTALEVGSADATAESADGYDYFDEAGGWWGDADEVRKVIYVYIYMYTYHIYVYVYMYTFICIHIYVNF